MDKQSESLSQSQGAQRKGNILNKTLFQDVKVYNAKSPSYLRNKIRLFSQFPVSKCKGFIKTNLKMEVFQNVKVQNVKVVFVTKRKATKR